MNPTGTAALSASKSSTLRPRARRLISVEDDIYATEGSDDAASRAASRNGSPVSSSKLASTAAPRPGYNVSANTIAASSFSRSLGHHTVKSRSTSATLSDLWGNPWSAIQGFAAHVMGADESTTDTDGMRRPRPVSSRRTSASAPLSKQWGPAGAGSHVGVGMHEEREAMVRAMKRRDLLTASEYLVSDSVGRIKRRTSDERLSMSMPPGDNEDRDALVYIHHVRPQDTLAGLSIRYNCDQAVLRKSNRMWPNDAVQVKKTLVLPVDACGVKGRPVPGPEALPDEDLLLGNFGSSASTISATTRDTVIPSGWAHTGQDTDTNSVKSSTMNAEQPWKHDSWILLPNEKDPIEIGRMPRRALGFFPPARRKSINYSDTSTPRASTDHPRSSTSTSTNPVTQSPSKSARPRASSNLSSLSAQNRQRNASNSAWGLHGPGGVGTLGRNVRSPGPAQDGLNKMFAAHLPSVAPPPGQEYFTPWAPSLLDADVGTCSHYAGTGSAANMNGGSLDLQEIGGAIEGWVRKVGSQASKLLNEPGTPGQGKRSAVPVLGAVGGDLGDLIELRDDAFEVSDEERERGRLKSNNDMLSLDQPPTSTPMHYQSINLDATALRERNRRGAGTGNKTD